jgi:hypothetical protein
MKGRFGLALSCGSFGKQPLDMPLFAWVPQMLLFQTLWAAGARRFVPCPLLPLSHDLFHFSCNRRPPHPFDVL